MRRVRTGVGCGAARWVDESKLILVIEHDVESVFRFERALHDVGVANPVRMLRHAEEMRCYLEGIGVYGNREIYPLPALIILDLDLPSQFGPRLLKWIRSHARFEGIPTIGLSAGLAPQMTQLLHDLGINAIYQKNADDAVKTAEAIRDTELLSEVLSKHRG